MANHYESGVQNGWVQQPPSVSCRSRGAGVGVTVGVADGVRVGMGLGVVVVVGSRVGRTSSAVD